MTEQTYPCPKCQQQFPISILHDHYVTCKGQMNVAQAPTPSFPSFPQFPQQSPAPLPMPQQYPAYQSYPQQPAPNPMYVAPPTPQHQHQWYENDTYKVCISFFNPKTQEDASCRAIKLKLRGSWMIFLRYGLKLFWIQLAGALALAFALASALGVHH